MSALPLTPDEKAEVIRRLLGKSELLGKWDDALGYYRLAAGTDGVKDDDRATYLDAKRRLTDDIGRILRSDSPQSRPAVVPDQQSQETKEKGHD